MRSSMHRDTWVEVDLDCIYKNVEQMKHHLPNEVGIIAVVKANGYGHGALPVAKVAIEAGATSLAVALLDEAILLRDAGITEPILVLGWVRPEDVKLAVEQDIMLTAFQLEWLQKAQHYLQDEDKLKVHFKIDTGMGRIGLRDKLEIQQVVKLTKDDRRFLIDGIYTHFATADEKETDYFNKQVQCFNDILADIHKLGVSPTVIHCANSATGLRFPEQVFNAVRFGISMYGLAPSEEIKDELPFPLHEAFSLHSRVIHVKQIQAGESVSYGTTYKAKEAEWIATIPIGYADGWIRKLSGADVLIDGKRCPIVGRICMDQCMVRLPHKVEVGTKVTLIGKHDNNMIPIDEVAQKLETINYEITCLISYRVPRMILRNKRIIEVKHCFYNQ